jgi:hypothetical protein
MSFAQIAQIVITIVISYLVAGSVKPQDREEPPELTEGDVPIAEGGIPIPVVFGTVRLSDPNVVWWGDNSSSPIIKKSGK